MTRRALVRTGAIVATIALAFWILKGTLRSAATIKWDLMDPWLIVAALAISSVQECMGTASAQAALAAFKQHTTFIRLLVVTTVATAANSVVPVPAGIPARIWLQKTWLGIPVASSSAAIALEMLCGYGLLALFAFAGALLFGANILTFGQRYLPAIAAFAALVLLVAWLLRGRLRPWFSQLAALRPAPLPTLLTVALNLAIIGLATSRLWLILDAFGSNAASIAEITAALCIARVAGVASMIPMGLGSRDVTLTGLLVLTGVSLPIAVLAAAADRVLSTIPYLAVALAGWPLLRRTEAIKHAGDTDH